MQIPTNERIVKAFYSTFSRMQCLRRGVLEAAGGRGASRSLSSSGGESSGETQVKSKTGVLMLNFISSCAINSLLQFQGTGEAQDRGVDAQHGGAEEQRGGARVPWQSLCRQRHHQAASSEQGLTKHARESVLQFQILFISLVHGLRRGGLPA